MPTYSIKAPNGKTYTIDGPPGASDTDVQAEVMRQFPEAAGEASQTGTVDPNDGLVTVESAPPEISFPAGTNAQHATEQVRSLFAHGAAPEDISAFIKEHGGTFADPESEAALFKNYETDGGTNADPRWRQAYAKHPDFTPFAVKVAQEPVSTGEAAATGLRNVGSMGFNDEIVAWLRSKMGLSADGQQPASQVGQTPDQVYKGALDVERGHSQAAWDQHPVAYAAGGAAGMAPTVVLAPGATVPEMAASGAVLGGVNGVGNATEGDRVSGGVTGAALGGAFGAGLGGAGKWLAGRIAARTAKAVEEAGLPPGSAPPLTTAQQTGAAAARQGLDVLPADVGGPAIRGMTGATAQFPLGVVPIAKAASRLDDQAAGRVSQIASDLGTAAGDSEGIGTAATEGALKYNKAARAAGGRMYDAAANAAGNATVDLAGTRAMADAEIARLRAVPGGGSGLDEMLAFRKALDKPAAIQGVRDMRTSMFVDPKWRGTPVEARMRRLADAAAQDAIDSLRSQGKGQAADMYRAADDNWRQMLVNLKRNIEPLVGPLDRLKSPEAVTTALNSAMKNNGSRVSTFIASLPAEQAQIVRASMLNPLGRDASGQFSISRFATDWDKLSPAAQRQVFGPESRAALEDLATVGRQSKIAKTYANHSNTGRAVIASKLVEPIGGGSTALGALAGVKTLGATLIAPYVSGAMLASPRFARWLARADKTTLSPMAYADRLTRIAASEPQIANEVIQLQQRITHAFGGGQLRAAAEPDHKANVGNGNSGQQQPPQGGLQP